MKSISLGTWCYTIGPYAKSPVDFDTVCTKLKALGFDGVELGAFAPHPDPDSVPTKDGRRSLVDKMKKWGLRFSGLVPNLWSQKLVNTADSKPYLNEFRKNCEFARDLCILGIRVDTVQPPTIVDEVGYDTALARVTKAFNECATIAAEYGLYVTWEFEPGFVLNKPSDVMRVLDAVKKPNFGVMYDTSHGQMVAVVGARQPGKKETLPGGQPELIRKLSGRINHVHLIDNDNSCHKDASGNDETSAHLPFGKGKVNFDEIVPLLAREKLPHNWWTIDLCFWPDAWEATADCKKFADGLNKKYGELVAAKG